MKIGQEKKKQTTKKIRFDIITLFPEMIRPYFEGSVLGKAKDKKIIETNLVDLKDFSLDKKYKKVDDRPFGGGPGMVLQFEPIKKAVEKIRKESKKGRVILFSTRGKIFNKEEARRLAKYEQLVLICGRYEGVDERVAGFLADEEISLGNFILTGGEIPAIAVADAVARFVPGVLGKEESLEENKGSYPVYTRPEEVVIKNKKTGEERKLKVPKVLLSGDHKKIEEWRKGFI